MYQATYDNGSLSLKINEVEVSLSNVIDTVKLTYDSGTSELACGVVIIPTLEFTLLNTVTCVLMDTVELNVGNIPFHKFIVVSADKQEYITKFKAYVEPYGNLSKGFFGDLENGYTVRSMLNEIATKTGVTIDGVDSLPNLPLTRGDVTTTGDDGTEQTQKGTNYEGKTYLEQLSLISGLLGKNIIFTRDNHIKFTNLNSTDIVLTDLEKPSMKTNSYRVNKIVCQTGKETKLVSGSATLSETLNLSNCYMTQEQLNALLTQFQAIEYEAFEFSHAQANLLIEPYDMVSFEYKGQNYVIPVQYLQIVFSAKGANYVIKSFVKQGESAVSEYKGTLTSRVDNVYTEVMQVRQLIANIGQFEEIEAVVAKIDNLYAKVGHIQNLLAGTITSEEIDTIHLTSQNAVIDNAIVKSEMIESLAVSKLASGVIDTSKIQIQATNGHMTIADNTIRFIDSKGNTRLYMGEDTNGNFSYQVYNANGSGLLLDENGLKEIAITDGLIKTNMINDQAITGDKINWTSFCESFNSSTNTNTLDSAHITMDGKRLDTAFNQLNTTVNGQTETINTHSTQLTQNANAIQGLVTATTITKEDGTTVGVKDEIANMKLTQDNFQVSITEKVDNMQIGGRNLWVLSDIVTGWVHSDGSITGGGDQHKTRQTLIPSNGAKELVYQCWNPNGISNSNNISRIGFFDIDMNYIGSYDIHQLNGDTYQYQLMGIPNNTAWMRLGAICGESSYDETIKIKFELGNKATDWSPAPEDVDTNITNAKNDAISSANNTLTNTIANYYTREETNSQINVAKNEINLGVSSTYETKTEVANKIEALDFDNTNYVRNSGFSKGLDYYGFNGGEHQIIDVPEAMTGKGVQIRGSQYRGIFQSIIDAPSGDYTVSFYLRTPCENPVGMYSKWEDFSEDNFFTATNEWTRVAYNVHKYVGDMRAVIFYMWENSENNNIIQIHSIKVEKGNKATQWTPNPLDVENSIDTAKQDAINSANNTLNSTIANYYTKEETNSQINVAKNEINLGVSSLRTEVMSASYNNLLSNSDFLTWENDFPKGYYSTGRAYCFGGGWICPEGGKTIVIDTSGGGVNWQGFTSSVIRVRQDQTLTASVYVAIDNEAYRGTVNFGIEITWSREDGSRINQSGTLFTIDTLHEWKRVSVTGTAPEGTVYAQVYCWNRDVGCSWWGKPMLQFGSAMTAWTRGGDLERVDERLSNAELKITDDAIISTVSSVYETKEVVESKTNTALNNAKTYADTKKSEAISTASSDATNKANQAKNDAIASANNTLNTTITNYYTKEETNSQINIAKNEINLGVSQTYETKAEVTNKINSIEVGGTNFMRNSSFQNEHNALMHWGGNGGDFVSIDVPSALSGKGLEIGGTTFQGIYQCPISCEIGVYTISFYLRTDSANPLTMFSRWEGFDSDKQLFTATNSWARCSYVVNKTRADANAIVFYLSHGADYNKIQIHSVQVERGNKVTDWSPSPFDTTGDIADAKNEAITSANNTLNTTIANYYTKDETNSQINIAKDNITSSVSSLRADIMNTSFANLLLNSDFQYYQNGVNMPANYNSSDLQYCYAGGWLCPEGGKTIHINTVGSGKNWYGWLSHAIKASKDQVFTASVYVATDNLSSFNEGLGLEIEWLNSNYERINCNGLYFNIQSSHTWERKSTTATAPEGTEYVRILCWHRSEGISWWGKPMLQMGSVCTAWDRGGSIDAVEQRLYSAEQKITDTAITNTVRQNFYTKEETENSITSKGYATSSQVQQTANDITFKFTQSGGYNFIHAGNAINATSYWGAYYLPDANWGVSNNEWTGYEPVIEMFAQNNTTGINVVHQIVEGLTIGETYAFSALVAGHRGTNRLVIVNGDGNAEIGWSDEATNYYGGTNISGWKRISGTFVATHTTCQFRLCHYNGWGESFGWFKQIQMNRGSAPLPFTPHPSEIYDGITTIDKNGLKITSSDFGGYTHITYSGFYLNNGSTDVFSVTSNGLKIGSNPSTSINGDVIRSGSIVANNGDLTFNLNTGQMYYKYAHNQVGFLGVTDGNSFSLSTDAKGWCMNSDYGSFSSMGAKSASGGNYVPYLTVTSGGVSNYNAGIFMSMPLNYGSATGTNMTVKNALELSAKVDGSGLFNPKISWRGSDVVTGARLFPRNNGSNGDRIDIYSTGDNNVSNLTIRLADDTSTYFKITCNHYTYGHQAIATFRYVESIEGYGIDFYRGLNMHNYNLGNVALKNAKSVQTASLALLDDVATVQTASPTAMYALDNGIEATQATITQHIATSINKTVTFNGTELVEGTSEYIELPQDFLMCVDIQVTLTPNKLCRFAVTSKDEYGFVIETDTEGVTFDYVVIGTKMDGTLFTELHEVEPDTCPVNDEEEYVPCTTDNLMLPQEFIDKGYTTFADATEEEMEAMKFEQVFGSPVVEDEEVTEEDKEVTEDEVTKDEVTKDEVVEEEDKVTEDKEVVEEPVEEETEDETEDEVIEETQEDIIIENEDDLNGIDTGTIIENY